MRAPGHGLQFDARGVGAFIVRQCAPARQAGFAQHRVDHPQGAAFPVGGNWQVDLGPVAMGGGCHVPGHNGFIALLHLAQLESAAHAALRLGVAGHQHQARCGLIEPVHHQGFGPLLLRPAAQAILLVRAAPRHAQQAGWLGQHQQVVVCMQAVDPATLRRHGAVRIRH